MTIALHDVSFRYRGSEREALDHVTLAVPEGRLLAVVGATGAGKTTLTRALAGIVPGFLRGQFWGAVRGLAREEVGIVFEDFESQLFTTDVELEVAFGPESRGLPREEIAARVKRALELVALTGFEGRSPATLSGGEKQRLAIAAAIAMEPKALILDEPTTDLDPVAKAQVMRVLRELRDAGRTIVLVEHETEELAAADDVAILAAGRLVRQAPAREVLADTATLEAHGIRAPELPRLFEACDLDPRTAPIDDDEAAAALLTAAGVGPAPGVNLASPPIPHRGSDVSEGEPKNNPNTGAGATGAAGEGGAGAGGEPILSARGVRHTYEGRPRPALDGVDFEVRAGDFVAILGANGSGKSTLARILNGLLVPDAGTVTGAGASKVGFVFQNPDHQIFCATVAEEVAFGPKNQGVGGADLDARVASALATIGLTGAEKRDPFALPKSDRQRLAVASVLAMETPVIIMDEPTTGLDHADQRRMMDLLRGLNEAGHTIIAITHHIWIALEYARRIVLMAEGTIVADKPVREAIQDAEALERARVRLPPLVRTCLRLGLPALSLDEAVEGLSRAS